MFFSCPLSNYSGRGLPSYMESFSSLARQLCPFIEPCRQGTYSLFFHLPHSLRIWWVVIIPSKMKATPLQSVGSHYVAFHNIMLLPSQVFI